MRSCLRPREGHGWPKRSPEEGDLAYIFPRTAFTGDSWSPDVDPVRSGISFPAQSFVSRPLLKKIKINLDPSHLHYCFVPPGRLRGNGGQQHTVFWHGAEFSRPRWRKIDHGGECLKSPPEV